MIANNIEALIGNTPLVKINTLSEETGTTILGKCEFMNPTSSVKDRIAFNMINEALKSGDIDQNTTINTFHLGPANHTAITLTHITP